MSLPTWNERSKQLIESFFLQSKRVSSNIDATSSEKQKSLLKELNLINDDDVFSEIGAVFFLDHPQFNVHIEIEDNANKLPKKHYLIKKPLLLARASIINTLKKLCSISHSNHQDWIGTTNQQFYTYPDSAIAEAVNLMLICYDYQQLPKVTIKIHKDYISYPLCTTQNEQIKKAFILNAWSHKNSEDYIKDALQKNNSDQSKGSPSYRLNNKELIIYRRIQVVHSQNNIVPFTGNVNNEESSFPIPSLITISAGTFQLGSPPSDPFAKENEKTLEQLDLPFFQISKYPITNQNYALFIQDINHTPPEHWVGKHPPDHLLDHPVVNVSITDAIAYCGWLSQQTEYEFALPTEMEWEKAARGDKDIRRYVWGDIWKPESCNTSEMNIGSTTPISQFEETNISPFGIVDMLGNVWEWTKSYYQQLPGGKHESMRYGMTHHVVRGGSWHNDQTLARISCRGRYLPGTKRDYLGFRIVTHTFINSDKEDLLSKPSINKEELRKNIISSFSREELRILCFDMNINADLFPEDIRGFTRELIDYCKRRDLLTNLIAKLRAERPKIDW